MSNQYSHQKEMDEVLENLKKQTDINPFVVIDKFLKEVHSNSDEAYSMLNDLEEAAVLKSYGLWYQNKFRDQDYFGNIRR